MLESGHISSIVGKDNFKMKKSPIGCKTASPYDLLCQNGHVHDLQKQEGDLIIICPDTNSPDSNK